MASIPSNGERLLLDVNAVAIGMVENHPGHEFVKPFFDAGTAGDCVLLTFDYFPLRAQYLMTGSFGVSAVDARNAIQSALRRALRIVSADRETLLGAYEISAAKNHDVYDCFLIALARTHEADAILTTDTDFEDLCDGESASYRNPVPDAVLERFEGVSG